MDNEFVPASPQQPHDKMKHPHRQRTKRKNKRLSIHKKNPLLPDASPSTSYQSCIASSSDRLNTLEDGSVDDHQMFSTYRERMHEQVPPSVFVDILASVRGIEKANRRTSNSQLKISKSEQDRLANLGFVASQQIKEGEDFPSSSPADLFADLQHVQHWTTQWPDLTRSGAESLLKTPPRSCFDMSKQIDNLSTPRPSIGSDASSAENTPRRTQISSSSRKRRRNFFPSNNCSESENDDTALEQTMRGIDDSNQIEPFMDHLTQVCDYLSQSWGGGENQMTKVAYTSREFGELFFDRAANEFDDGLASNVIEKRKPEDAADTDNPSKKPHLDIALCAEDLNQQNKSWPVRVPTDGQPLNVTSVVSAPDLKTVSAHVNEEEIFSVYKDSLTDEFEFTQLKQLTVAQKSKNTALQPVDMNKMTEDTTGPVIAIKPFLPLATIAAKNAENFVGFASARGFKIACKPVQRNIFDGIDDELEKEFEAAKKDCASRTAVPSFTRPRISSDVLPPIISDNKFGSTAATEFGGFRSARGNKFQNKIPRKNIFAGVDDEVERDFKMGTFATADSKQYKSSVTSTITSESNASSYHNTLSTPSQTNVDKRAAEQQLPASEFVGFMSACVPHKTKFNGIDDADFKFNRSNKAVPPTACDFTSSSKLLSGVAATHSPALPKTQARVRRSNIFEGIDAEVENDFKMGNFEKLVNKKLQAVYPGTSNQADAKMANNRFSTPTKPIPGASFNMATHLLNDRSSTPIAISKNSRLTLTQEVSNVTAAILKDEAEAVNNLDDRQFKDVFYKGLMNPPSAIAVSLSPIDINLEPRNKNLRQTKLLHRFNAADDEEVDDGVCVIDDSLDENFTRLTDAAFETTTPQTKITLTQEVVNGRRKALLDQTEATKNKADAEKGKRSGKLYTTKQQNSQRQTLKEMFGEKLPERMNAGLAAKIAAVSASNAVDFQFDMEDYYNNDICESNTAGVQLADGASLIFNEHSQAGISEFKSSFLSLPGVDVALVPEKWIENAFKWIVLKLASMDRHFTSEPTHYYLNPENVLLQLKYRYDREIDNAERPALRKMLEKDDLPSKPMCLFVANVYTHLAGVDLELSDGWYAVRTQIDAVLRHFVKSGKLKIGTKLMVQNAELVGMGETGCHPMEVKEHVRLKICANSSRRALWHTNLGYCSKPRPLSISLNSVLENGGVISETVVFILRLYPIMFVDRSTKSITGSSVLRSEKMQNRYCMELDTNRLAIIEKTYHQIQLEIEAEDKIRSQQFRSERKSTPHKISDIIDAEQLCDLLEFGHDPAAIEAELTESQKKLVENYQTSLKAMRDADISERVKDKLKEVHELEQQMCPLLKVRICDAKAPGKSMILSIWRPSEEVIGMMRERNIVRMSSVSANASRYNEIQISAGKMSRFEVINQNSDRYPSNLAALRQLTPLGVISSLNFSPCYNEFDVVGVVVKIGEVSKFQLVYIADAELNLLSINFWAGVKKFAYEDIVKVKTVLCASNVQWRPSDANKNGIPRAYASEYTTFKRRPAQQEMQEAVAALQTALAAMDLDEFVKKCIGKINELESKPAALLVARQTPGRTPAMNSSTPMNCRTPASFSSHNPIQRFAGCATPREFSPGVGVPSSNVHERLKRLLETPSPPPLPSINLNKSNYRVGLRAPPRTLNPSNPQKSIER